MTRQDYPGFFGWNFLKNTKHEGNTNDTDKKMYSVTSLREFSSGFWEKHIIHLRYIHLFNNSFIDL